MKHNGTAHCMISTLQQSDLTLLTQMLPEMTPKVKSEGEDKLQTLP